MLIQFSKCPKCGKYTVILICSNCGYKTPEYERMEIENQKFKIKLDKAIKKGKITLKHKDLNQE